MKLIGRRSSVFTRVPLYFAERLEIPFSFQAIPDMTQTDPESYGGNPALKLPTLQSDAGTTFGAQNICRVMAEHPVTCAKQLKINWPEALADAISRNAQELIWHCMSAQVQLVMGTVIAKLPPDNVFFVKARTGLEGSLRWLDSNLDAALTRLPPHDISLLEVTALCLIDHLAFRPTVTLDPYARLRAFSARFAFDPAALKTAYRFDT